ncbi:MAG: hypothetical protein V7605_1686 [Acidimicrobiaceae bacterium]
MSARPHQIIEAARIQAAMSFDELWLAYFALGGACPPDMVRSYLGGTGAQPMDYDVLAQALNERFVDAGGNHPVPYSDDIA